MCYKCPWCKIATAVGDASRAGTAALSGVWIQVFLSIAHDRGALLIFIDNQASAADAPMKTTPGKGHYNPGSGCWNTSNGREAPL